MAVWLRIALAAILAPGVCARSFSFNKLKILKYRRYNNVQMISHGVIHYTELTNAYRREDITLTIAVKW
jgi:hypothetical protein